MAIPKDNEQPIRPRAGPTRRAILAVIGAGGLSTTIAAATGGDNENENGDDDENEDENGDENDEDEEPSIEEIEIAESHGENPGEYDPTDTVYGDEFYVPFSAQGIEDGGSFHVTIVDPDTNEIMDVESGQFDGAEVVHGWPEFDTCGILFCWDPGTYRAVVTATNTADVESDAGSTEFRIAN